MSDEKTIAERIQHAIDKRRAQLTPEQQEKNKRSAENLLQAVSDVWNNKVPTPWAVGAMQDTSEDELAEQCSEAFVEGALSTSLGSGPRVGWTNKKKKKMKRMTAEEFAKSIADRWVQNYAEFNAEEEKK